ncbi:MAG: GrpB family protein [Roseibium sp.]|nr:GrpB family protein [Roseibium sp.]
MAEFDPFDPIVKAMMAIGYLWRSDNPDLAKRYFREQPGSERTHIHIRRSGSWHEQWALLFRDFMRAHPKEKEAYADLKRTLAHRHRQDRAAYTIGKDDYFWHVIRQADRWATKTGWVPPISDA